jgi:Ca2+-binding RTX toxin-like protein
MRRLLTSLVTAGLLLGTSYVVVPAGQAAAPGPDRVRCDGRVATIVGTNGVDRIDGTSGDDVIATLGGGDAVNGRGGDDVICGGPGSDVVKGGPGDDRLLGGADGTGPDSHCQIGHFIQGDRLVPGPGDDVVDAGYDARQSEYCGAQPDLVTFRDSRTGIRAHLGRPGTPGVVRADGDRDVIRWQRLLAVEGSRRGDRIVGGPGVDWLYGNGGTDVLLGGEGNDRIEDRDHSRYTADDRLDGGPGDDSVLSERGPDDVTGGEGDDSVLTTVASCSVMSGGPGRDTFSLSGNNLPIGAMRVVFDAAAGTTENRPVQAPCGHVSEMESYVMNIGGVPLDFAGTEGPDELRAFGQTGITATMRGGDDVVSGTDADDVIDGGDGVDTVNGSLGRDVCISAETALSCDSDSLPLPPPSCDGRAATIVATAGKPVVGTAGDDVIAGTDGDDRIDGLGGNDVICGRAGADAIAGGDGSDRIFGGEDHFDVEGYFIGDTVKPGPGDDVVDLGFDPRRTDEQVADTLDYPGSAGGLTTALAAVGGTFTVTGEGADTVTTHHAFLVKGSQLADVITGSPGDDHVAGMGGDDVIDGGSGNDTLDAEDECSSPSSCSIPPDHDVVTGGEGDDHILSGLGRDDLDGGAGVDFVSSSSVSGVGTMQGGPGDDLVQVTLRTADLAGQVDGGADTDEFRVLLTRPLPAGTRVALDATSGRLSARGLGDLVTFAGFEDYDVDLYDAGSDRRPFVIRFLGSDADERLSVVRYASVLRATMGAGNDVVRGTNGDDVVDGGAGRDIVRMFRGRDVCRSVEVEHGCER